MHASVHACACVRACVLPAIFRRVGDILFSPGEMKLPQAEDGAFWFFFFFFTGFLVLSKKKTRPPLHIKPNILDDEGVCKGFFSVYC